jgi:hypothetical protein
VPTITCYHCFLQFKPSQLHFKCLMHRGESVIFPYRASGWWPTFKPPVNAVCPRDALLTGFRVCPNPQCHGDLPYYVGRASQRIVAVTGCGGTGKTVYLWSLLHQVREELARDVHPYASAMFEDDASFRTYQGLCQRILHERRVPDFTDPQAIRAQGRVPPLIVRVLSGNGKGSFCNLVFYDPAGELFENLTDGRYLRYLSSSAGIIYLMDPPGDDERASTTSQGLTTVLQQIRLETPRLPKHKPIPKPLAVVVTKADEELFRREGIEELVAGHGQGQDFWHSWDRASREEVDRASARVEAILQEGGYDDLVNKARLNFQHVRFFAVSSLGKAPVGGTLPDRPGPVGVENPLYWILKTLR